MKPRLIWGCVTRATRLWSCRLFAVGLFLSVLATSSSAQFCPATYNPHDRGDLREEYLRPTLLHLSRMHTIALFVLAESALSWSQIQALDGEYKQVLLELREEWEWRRIRMRKQSRGWVERVASSGFPELSGTTVGGADPQAAKRSAKSALGLIDGATSQIGWCF
jgi:hypothetical protein